MTDSLTTHVEEFSDGLPERLKTAWEECVLASPESERFLTSEWAQHWARTLGSTCPWTGKGLLFTEQTAEGKIVAILPLVFGSKGHLRVVTPAGFYQPFRWFVCIPEFASQAIPRLVDAICDHRHVWDLLRIFPYYATTPERVLFLDSLKARFAAVRVTERGRTIVNTLADSYEHYARMDSVKKIEYYGRRLANTAPYSIRHFCNPTDDAVTNLLDGLRTIEAKSWLPREQGNLRFVSDASRRFWESLIATSLSPRQQLNAWILYVRDAPVAFRFCIVSGTTSYMIANQYDDAYSDFRPGWLLYLQELAYDCAHGIRRIDMGPGDGHYKERWGGKQDAMQLEITVFSPTWTGRLADGVYAITRQWQEFRTGISTRFTARPHSFTARGIAGLRSLWNLKRSDSPWNRARIRSALWRRTHTVIFAAERSQKPVPLTPGLRIVKVHPGDPNIPVEDIRKAGAGDDFGNLARGAICYLAYEGKTPVGLGWMFKDSYLLARIGFAGSASYLAGYHVVEAARRRGIYTVLLKVMAHDVASQGKTPMVDASPDNMPSIRGIEKAGFRKTGTLNCLVIAGMIVRAVLTPVTPRSEQMPPV